MAVGSQRILQRVAEQHLAPGPDLSLRRTQCSPARSTSSIEVRVTRISTAAIGSPSVTAGSTRWRSASAKQSSLPRQQRVDQQEVRDHRRGVRRSRSRPDTGSHVQLHREQQQQQQAEPEARQRHAEQRADRRQPVERRCRASPPASTPSGIAIANARISATSVSSMVAGRRSTITSRHRPAMEEALAEIAARSALPRKAAEPLERRQVQAHVVPQRRHLRGVACCSASMISPDRPVSPPSSGTR